MYNGLFLNPGSTGIGISEKPVTEFGTLVRLQWIGIEGAPRSQVFWGHTPISKINSGIGIHVFNDNAGPLHQLTVNLDYAYHLEIGDGILGIGPSLGILNNALDGTMLKPNDVDPILPKSGKSEMKFDLSAGAWYKAKKYYVGLSSLHLIPNEYNFSDLAASPSKYEVPFHFYLTGGYHFDITREIDLTPSLIAKNTKSITQFEGSAMAGYNKRFYFGLAYRQLESASVLVGFNFLKDNAAHFGYSYDFILNDLNTVSSGSHEFLLTYSIPKKIVLPPAKIIIRTPRFRLE
ncbi:MAG: hypothetical protein A3H98_07350 [Bacteroidetes bacterium RIFCSPLOWO2_02_FULL_36_8]|nr:MAG: hypothetical protein A3H98_07350 [Bacteroidetes bacterium RIFCSPLOWO2_02_FULL_36_8]OFY69908.1 MAG: hypothetical protein A3G23_05460 [Bacteroidetes bacterium RIFCSPLOWO2_12_FULL_37_12]